MSLSEDVSPIHSVTSSTATPTQAANGVVHAGLPNAAELNEHIDPSTTKELPERLAMLSQESGKGEEETPKAMRLELQDGTLHQGFSFGANKSVSGELVFQTGMIGYPESITDPSYRGQILVITFPLIGNYGVPSRDTVDPLLTGLPAHFEASEIHVAGLIVASYSGENYSHHLATSSLGTWLKEQNVPALYGVDTRALTKRIREEGSMLGRMLMEKESYTNGTTNGNLVPHLGTQYFETVDWIDPNAQNLVADGE